MIHTSVPATGEDTATSSLPGALLSHSRSLSSRLGSRRRHWSVLGNIFSPTGSQNMRGSPSSHDTSLGSLVSTTPPTIPESEGRPLARSLSTRTRFTATAADLAPRPSTSEGPRPPVTTSIPPVSTVPSTAGSSSYRLLPRFFSTAFGSRRSDGRTSTLVLQNVDVDSRKNAQSPQALQSPPPKLEYVKLPGTKGSILIKAVETQKKRYAERAAGYSLLTLQ